MRRMISESELNNIKVSVNDVKADVKKLSDNIVVNEDGTLVEIGGNVAVESIEQLGYIGEATIGGKYTLYDKSAYTTDIVIATNVSKVEIVSGGTPSASTFSMDDNTFMFSQRDLEWYYKINGQVYKLSRQNQWSVKIYGDCVTTSIATVYTYVEAITGPSFTPFFTEEQYTALLALIENA